MPHGIFLPPRIRRPVDCPHRPGPFTQRVRKAEADGDAAHATQAVQQAQVAQAQANLLDAQRDFTRKQQLVEKKFVSAAERDKAQTTLESAIAALQLARAQLLNGQTQVRQRQALLIQAQVDLQRTSIRSPVDGVVVKRSVDIGQTVAASLQAPELFIIAKNLTDMQVETSVDEADVGRIQPRQHASFTVDAFPGRRFTGEVRQVRKAANVRIVTAHKDNALKVANAALRFRPTNLKESQAVMRVTQKHRKTHPAPSRQRRLFPPPQRQACRDACR